MRKKVIRDRLDRLNFKRLSDDIESLPETPEVDEELWRKLMAEAASDE